MKVQIFNKHFGRPGGFWFVITNEEFLIRFTRFFLHYHKKDKDVYKNNHFALIIGGKRHLEPCFLHMTKAYSSTKSFFGVPVQSFLNKDFTNNDNSIGDESSF